MSEDTLIESSTPEPELSPVEQAAMEKGWKPKEEYQGDPERWRSAEVFLALDEPLKRIEHQSKEMKQLRQALEAFKEHHTKVEASAFDRALASLKAERRQAILDGDAEKALDLEEQADTVKAQKAAVIAEGAKPVVQDSGPHPEFVEWQTKNSWYQKDTIMTAAADAVGRDLAKQGYTPAQVLKAVEEKIREEFPQKFKPAGASRPQAVEGSSRSGSTRATSDVAMDASEREIMRKIVGTGVMTEAEYKAELKKARGN